MRSVKSGLLALAVTGFLGAAVAIGCSASGDGTTDDVSGTDPGTTTPPNTLPPSTGTDPTPPPPPPKDAGKKDSSVDAGPPPPNPGDPCTKADSLATKPCGKCGTQQAICQSKDGTDGGALVWSDYGMCSGELTTPDSCVPGTTGPCGNCGTATCSKYCAWSACTMPTGACKAGATDYTMAGCTSPNTYRARTCSNTCSWSGYAATCAPPNNPNKMTIPTSTTAAPTSANWNLTATDVGERLEEFGGCPGSVATETDYPYVIVEVQNPTAQKATVTIQSLPGTAGMDVIVWAYNKTLPPTDDSSLQACDYAPTDSCPSGSGITCPASGYWGGLKGVTINAGASVLVMISSYYYLSEGFGTPTGTVNLQVKTTGLM